MDQKDPYDILGVARGASQDEVKRAYRRLAKQFHPDRNPGDKSAEPKFKEVQAAYEVLGDAERRAQFDRFGAGGPKPDYRTWTTTAGGTPFEGVQFDFEGLGDLGSIFEQFFHRPAARRRSGRRSVRRAPVRGADLEHAVELTFDEAVRGTARELRLALDGAGGHVQRIEVRFPAGVVPLSMSEAVLGAKIDVPTLDGVTRLTIPPGTSGGTRLRLRGKGIRDQRASTAGDMYVIPHIAVPKDVSPRARELLDQLASELGQHPRAGLGWAK